MSDEIDSYLADLEIAFGSLKKRAELCAAQHNEFLPDTCACGNESYVEGLACPDCGYQAGPELAHRVVEPDEFGYVVVALGNRRRKFATFHIESEM